jgi:hypothetical protein
VWSFAVSPLPGNPEWQSLDDGLKRLAETLMPFKSALHELQKRFTTVAYCGHFGSGFGGGPSIAPQTLGLLAGLGLTLTIKTYWSEEQASDTAEGTG